MEQQPEIHGIYAAVSAYALRDPSVKEALLKEIRAEWDGVFNVQGAIEDGQFVVAVFYDGRRFGEKPLEHNPETEIIEWLSGLIPHSFHVLPMDDLHIEESIGHAYLHYDANPGTEGDIHKTVMLLGIPHTRFLPEAVPVAEPVEP